MRAEWEENNKLSTRFFYNTVDGLEDDHSYFPSVVEFKRFQFSSLGFCSDPGSGEVKELSQHCQARISVRAPICNVNQLWLI